MARWQPQRGWRRFLYTRTAIIVVAIIGLLFGRSVWQSFWRQRLVISDRERIEQDLVALKERESKLKNEIASLKTENGLEEKIREKFPVIKSGERVITIVASGTATSGVASSSSWWQSLWGKKSD